MLKKNVRCAIYVKTGWTYFIIVKKKQILFPVIYNNQFHKLFSSLGTQKGATRISRSGKFSRLPNSIALRSRCPNGEKYTPSRIRASRRLTNMDRVRVPAMRECSRRHTNTYSSRLEYECTAHICWRTMYTHAYGIYQHISELQTTPRTQYVCV